MPKTTFLRAKADLKRKREAQRKGQAPEEPQAKRGRKTIMSAEEEGKLLEILVNLRVEHGTPIDGVLVRMYALGILKNRGDEDTGISDDWAYKFLKRYEP